MIFVCSYGCVVGPAGVWARRDDVRSLHSAYINRFLTDPLRIRKNTQKSKFLLSQAFKWKKIMFFVIPEMPSKTFVMVLKKLPDHFKMSKKGSSKRTLKTIKKSNTNRRASASMNLRKFGNLRNRYHMFVKS